ncbi:hypothetical protein LOD99_6347 [Oopsacas minuta]|uniref:Uncharacterized protein n=1 Tax=Oopsacas minuta TaxID=111878 RepID=A0AAV7JME1_9METZ|nr:hypothetical protein LOD99_6346 [Oopsacas minuta]KAI6649983.1 hypothetical protein LOD99_6347 [Oopsacas minuta]
MSNNFGGRKLDPVHDQYCPSSIPSKRICMHCNAEVGNKCIRLRALINKCTSIPNQVTEIEKEFIINPKLTSCSGIPILSGGDLIQTKQSHLTSDRISMNNSKEKESFGKVVAMFFYSCSIPFNIAVD